MQAGKDVLTVSFRLSFAEYQGEPVASQVPLETTLGGERGVRAVSFNAQFRSHELVKRWSRHQLLDWHP
jgi:hypothetical protein